MEMGENELEEGEACYYPEKDEGSIDPDVHLSYIDEKIQAILGDFQKDFEGGVSAENLGSKFGGYGSFLPSYQRSPPILSHPKTPQKVQNYNAPKSPNNLQSESTGELTPKHKPVNKPTNPTKQKTLKVRIKVGPDCMTAKTNAEIYSGLGLDISPSSSLEDSAAESGGLSLESHDAADESPTIMLRNMTSFPVLGGSLLSPLADSLLCLTEKEKLLIDSRHSLAYQCSQASSATLGDEFPGVREDKRVPGEKKKKSVKKKSVEVSNKDVNDAGNGSSFKETDVGNPVPPHSLKFPLVCKSKGDTDDRRKDAGWASDVTGELNKHVVKDLFFDFAKKEKLESTEDHNVDYFRNQSLKNNVADNFLEDKKTCYLDQPDPSKYERSKKDKTYDPSSGGGLDGSNRKKDLIVGPVDPLKQKTLYERHGLKEHHVKEESSARGKKKSKGSQGKNIPAEEFPKESSRVGSSSSTKYKKKSTGEYPSKNKLENKRLHNGSGKTRESRDDVLEDTKMELKENRMDLEETPRHNPMDSVLQILEKETPKFVDKAKKRSSVRKVENQLKSEAYSKSSPMVTPLSGNGPVSDAVPATVAPVVIEENWVACDKCEKWRLLPYGTNPDNLPKKWLCSMLNWLPGMNRCNVSEEETTKALNALYQLPAPENRNSLNNLPHGAASRVTSADVQHLDQTQQGYDLHGGFSGDRKKLKSKEAGNESKEAVNAAMSTYPAQLSNSTKKSLLVTLKSSRSLHGANQSPLESNLANGAGSQQSSYAKHSKLNRKRGQEQDEFRVSKKSKNAVYTDERRNYEHDRGAKVGLNSISGISTNVPEKDVHKEAKDAQYDSKDEVPVSVKKLKGKIQVSLNGGPLNTVGIAAKKRKVREWQESQIYQPESPSSAGHHFEDNNVSVKEEMSESERRKEKKARVSKSEGKESSSSKGGDKTDKRGRVTRIHISGSKNPLPRVTGEDDSGCFEKDQQLGKYEGANTASQRSLDGIDIRTKDSGYVQHSVTAASSSSKVSGSRKSRFNVQEVKGSPVESVSSSPLRIANPDKVIPARRKLLGNDNATNVRFSVMGTPRRCSDGEVGGGNVASETERVERAFPRSSLGACALDQQVNDANHTSGDKSKAHIQPYSSNIDNPNTVNDRANASDQHKPYLGELLAREPGNDGIVKNTLYSSNGSQLQKSVKASSLRSKDKHRSSKSAYGEGDINVFDSFSERELSQTKNLRHHTEIGLHNHLSYNEESRDEKNSLQEKCGAKSNKVEKNGSGKEDSLGIPLSEDRKERRAKFGEREGSNVKLGGTGSKDGKSRSKQKLLQVSETEEPSNRFVSVRADHLETQSKNGKSKSLPYSGDKQEILAHPHRPTAGKIKGSGSDILPVDASGCSANVIKVAEQPMKVAEQPKKLDNQNGTYHSSWRQSTTNGLVARDLESQSPVRKDSSSQAAANAFKEAKNLKHTADRLKNIGEELESTGIYFQAALKFLQGASLLELSNNESSKHGEIPYMIEMYSSTAKLCEFVAREYERFKKMTAAALAYKCMEVAYMKVIYSKNSTVSKDRHELQTALQMVPPGESPSSSSSDVDNLNNQGTLDKVVLAKNGSSPQITGNHVIVARNQTNFVRLLNFAQNVNFAMEATRKSHNALAAANAGSEDADAISSVKTVIDFTFHDVDGLLRLVRLAMEAISR